MSSSLDKNSGANHTKKWKSTIPHQLSIHPQWDILPFLNMQHCWQWCCFIHCKKAYRVFNLASSEHPTEVQSTTLLYAKNASLTSFQKSDHCGMKLRRVATLQNLLCEWFNCNGEKSWVEGERIAIPGLLSIGVGGVGLDSLGYPKIVLLPCIVVPDDVFDYLAIAADWKVWWCHEARLSSPSIRLIHDTCLHWHSKWLRWKLLGRKEDLQHSYYSQP